MRSHSSRLPLFAAVLLAGLAPLLLLRAAESEERRYALLVGVKNYKKDQFRSLLYTENDVNALAGVFTEAGYKRVVLMTHEKAKDDVDLSPTAKNIRAQLKGLLEDRKETDTVVVAFSGHGVQFVNDKGHYFCPTDADLTDRSTLISLKDVYDEVKKSKARVKLLLVDACRNDPLAAKKSRALDRVDLESRTRPQKVEVPGGVAALFSCSAGQESFESDKLKHGMFFYHVLEGLRGKAANRKGAVDLSKLFAYVADEVPDAVKEEHGVRARQKPELRGEIIDMEIVPPGRALAKNITNSIGMKLVLIPATPAGKGFLMGSTKAEQDDALADYEKSTGKKASDTVLGWFRSESPRHEVEITKAYYLGVYTVTQAEYEKVMEENPSWFSASGSGKDKVNGLDTRRFPVERVTWHDAVKFCEKLSGLAKEKAAGRVYRLPSEAEWEYACRAGTRTAFHYGSSLSSRQANFNGNYPYGGVAKGPYLARTCEVGSYRPNGFGLYDMHGNVWQWCSDWFDKDYYQNSPKRDPKGPDSGERRVLRGGCWYGIARSCRAAIRYYFSPGNRDLDVGFRVACGAARTR